MIIIDIKPDFLSEGAYRVYSSCMFEPTFEKFEVEAQNFIANENVSVFGCFDNEALRGIIALKSGDEAAEIEGIAVDEKYRGKGIGKELVVFAAERFGSLYAETDDDAVGFYKSCGFETESFVRTFPNGQRMRYRCTLNMGG